MSPSDAAGSAITRRLHDLIGLAVVSSEGVVIGHVNDVRLARGPAVHGVRSELVVDGLIVADRHAGSMLGYDRRRSQGPWLVRRAVRALHRRAGYAPWESVREIEWGEGGRVVLSLERLGDLDGM
jgi:sporulation protein YlmC with PRC-barrel domain